MGDYTIPPGGGTVILPMPVGNADPAGLLSNRQLSLWPYTRISDPRLKLGDEYVLFKANALPPFKMGYFNAHGWMAYWLEGILFRKALEAQTESIYPDNNSNAEMYCNERFVELESLGPIVKLLPGNSVNHLETWDVFTDLDCLPVELQDMLIES